MEHEQVHGMVVEQIQGTRKQARRERGKKQGEQSPDQEPGKHRAEKDLDEKFGKHRQLKHNLGLAPRACKESTNPFVMNKTTLRPVAVDPEYAASFRDSLSWVETLAPTRMWLSRHYQTIENGATYFVSNFGNVMEDFARSETESRPGWTYVNHHDAWACEYEPEARVQTHFEHDKARGYRGSLRTWLAVRSIFGLARPAD